MAEKIRAAMLGMGNIGRTHLENLRKIPEEVEVAALCSDDDSADRYNQENGTSYPVYRDFDQMLDEQDFDVLYVSIPPFAHNGQIEKAAARGISIFAEKPLATTLERAESITRAIEENHVLSMMGYHRRFGGAVRRVKELIDSGVAGKPTLFIGSYEANSLHTPWWRHRELSGGQVYESVIHLYDLSYYLFGDVDCISGFKANLCHTDVPGYTVEDVSSMSLRYKNGALGSITGSNCSVPGEWNGLCRIIFENLVAVLTDESHGQLIYTKENNRVEDLDFDEDVHWIQDRYFIDVLEGKAPEFEPVREGLAGLRIVTAAVQSSDQDGLVIRL